MISYNKNGTPIERTIFIIVLLYVDYIPNEYWLIVVYTILAIPNPIMPIKQIAKPIFVYVSLLKDGIGSSEGVIYIAFTTNR